MLRYDGCVPASGTDSSQITQSLRGHGITANRIRLLSLSGNKPTAPRWKSFGWEIVE